MKVEKFSLKNGASNMKKDLRTLGEKAQDHASDLWEALDSIQRGFKPHKKYLKWSLQDCVDMIHFYAIIESGRYRLAYNKLDYLGKQCGLVPDDIYKELFNMFSPNKL
jgi:hypothetical protein